MFRYFWDLIKIQFKNLNKIFILSVFVGIFLPLLYTFLRTLFIIDNGSNSYAMTQYWVYIQVALEVIGAFLILPIFTFNKEHHLRKNIAILFFVIIILIFILIILFSFTPILLDDMEKMNNDQDITRNDLRNFLFISIIANIFLIYEQFLLSEVICEQKSIKVLILTALSLTFKISIDLLFLAPFSPIEFNINNLALSQLISSFIIILVLQIMWILSYLKNKSKAVFSELKKYFYRGIIPGLESFIRNFFYIFVTLEIVNSLGENEWNSWNLANWIYWQLLFQFVTIFQYSLVAERVNNKKINSDQATYFFIFIDILIFLILTPILITFIIPILIDSNEINWLNLTTQTAWILFPFMLILSITTLLKTKFLVENKLHYILISTIITNFIIYFPVFICLQIGINFNYNANLILWSIGIFLSFITCIFQFKYLLNNTNFAKI